jgi:hypothetical protein
VIGALEDEEEAAGGFDAKGAVSAAQPGSVIAICHAGSYPDVKPTDPQPAGGRPGTAHGRTTARAHWTRRPE